MSADLLIQQEEMLRLENSSRLRKHTRTSRWTRRCGICIGGVDGVWRPERLGVLALDTVGFRDLLGFVGHVPFWHNYLLRLSAPPTDAAGLHIAVLIEPYLSLVLDGKKTVESRFGAHRQPPYQAVFAGDVILLKRASGPIVGVACAVRTWCFPVNAATFGEIRRSIEERICAADETFWEERRSTRFATLIELGEVTGVAAPLPCDKRDRRGWVTLRSRQLNLGIGL